MPATNRKLRDMESALVKHCREKVRNHLTIQDFAQLTITLDADKLSINGPPDMVERARAILRGM